MKVQEKVDQTISTSKRIFNNLEQFAQAVSLLVVAGFGVYATTKLVLHPVLLNTVRAAIAIIGLRGAVEFLKFMSKEQ